jgi:hypothetical protein
MGAGRGRLEKGVIDGLNLDSHTVAVLYESVSVHVPY